MLAKSLLRFEAMGISIYLSGSSLSFLQVTADAINVQDVLEIIHDCNIDAALCFSQIVSVKECLGASSSTLYNICSNSEFTVKSYEFFVTYFRS